MNEQILFEKKEVYIIEAPKEDTNGVLIESNKIGGRLQIFKNKYSTFVRFLPYGCDPSSSDDWDIIVDNTILTYTRDSKEDEDIVSLENKSNNRNKYRLQFDLNQLSAVRRNFQGYGIPSIVFMLKDGHTWPNLYFFKGGSKDYLKEINSYIGLRKDTEDASLWCVPEQNSVAFQQSMYELNLFNEQREDVVKKFFNQPIQSTLLSFSKVTSIFKDALKPSDNHQMYLSNLLQEESSSPTHSAAAASSPSPHSSRTKQPPRNHTASRSTNNNNNSSSSYSSKRNAAGGLNFEAAHLPQSGSAAATNLNSTDEEMHNGLMDSLTSENIHSTLNDCGYEMVTKVDLGPMPEVERGQPLKSLLYDDEGRLLCGVGELREQVFRGGIDHSLRPTLWKFLLDYYEWSSTSKGRAEKRSLRENDYYRIKLQWESVSDEQKLKFSLMKERESLIEKDVQRTDRVHVYFEGEHNKNLNTMKDILMTYNMYNFDLGYVQGMSDLLAPIMVLMNDEVDSFWCFVGLMNKMEGNFLMDQLNIKMQLNNLKALLEFVDSKFSDYLEKNESSNMYFCFRWILIMFKREFSFPDIMRLWEVMWTDLPCSNFHLLVCIAILLMKKDDIVANNYGFNEILKFINDLSLRIDLEKTLKYAEGLYIQIKSFKNLPVNISKILNLPIRDDEATMSNEENRWQTSKLASNDKLNKSSTISTPSKNSVSTRVNDSANKTSPTSTTTAAAATSKFTKEEDTIEVLN